jgi:PiT family inorganic phosphate transporter
VEHFLVTSGTVLAFFFAFVSGVHDGGNLVAASVLSRSIAPRRALLLAAAAAFAGPLLCGSAVAVTLSEVFLEGTILQPSNRILLCLFLVSAVGSATLWNIMTWWIGRPSGSSYALLGGLLGGGVAAFGFEVIHSWTLFYKVILFLLLCPILGAMLARLGMTVASRIPLPPDGGGLPAFGSARGDQGQGWGWGSKPLHPHPAPLPQGRGRHWAGSVVLCGLLQGLSLFFQGMGHGANNAQKSAAVILMLLLSSGSSSDGQLPFWAILGCSASLAAGVPVGGWEIARTLRGKTFRIRPVHSFAAQLAAGVVLAAANLLGGLLSPNQLVKASILGTGAGCREKTPWWILGKNVIMAWFIHLPASALIAAAVYWCASRALGLGMGSLERIMGGLGP